MPKLQYTLIQNTIWGLEAPTCAPVIAEGKYVCWGVTKLKHASVQINLTLPERTELLRSVLETVCANLAWSSGDNMSFRAIISTVCVFGLCTRSQKMPDNAYVFAREKI